MDKEKKKASCYDDMLHMPHHVSDSHPPMPLDTRAAQFSPFAALTGFDAAIEETARLTEEKRELDEDSRAALDEKFHIIMDHIQEHPLITVTSFLPDTKKEGGSYISVTGSVKKIDTYKRVIVMMDGQEIRIDDIAELCGNFFNKA